MTASQTASARGLRERVAEVPLWYHTLDLGGGVLTPGWFDLRPIVESMPWPDVAGKRCLDVGTWDGFLAFELERRGASEVIATDIEDHASWDWPATLRRRGTAHLESLAGPERGRGFAIAKEALGSSVRRELVSVYDLTPERLGHFDVVVCGSLLLHLRDPMGALEAIASVCAGQFLSAEQIDLRMTALHRRRAMAVVRPDDVLQWWSFNAHAHVRMLETSGFEVERTSSPYAIPFGRGHSKRPMRPRRVATDVARRVLTGGTGVPHRAVLARLADQPAAGDGSSGG
jgi:tRNA (mo5U34)-methyltransferase